MDSDTELAAGALLTYLDTGDRAHLTSIGERRTYPVVGETVLRQGDPTDHVLVVLGGWVRVSASSVDGTETLIALRGPGDVLGDLAALHGWDRTATVQTLSSVEALQLRSPAFLECLRMRPGIALAMIKQMSVRLREAEAALEEFATLDVGGRVAAYLARLMEQHGTSGPDGVTLRMPLSQQDIAGRVGASLRAVTRSMGLLRERGVVITARRRIVIARPDVLRAFARSTPHGA